MQIKEVDIFITKVQPCCVGLAFFQPSATLSLHVGQHTLDAHSPIRIPRIAWSEFAFGGRAHPKPRQTRQSIKSAHHHHHEQLPHNQLKKHEIVSRRDGWTRFGSVDHRA